MAATAYQESDQDVLFILKVDMGGGKHEFINYGNDDTPEQASFRFCQEHSLNIKVYDFITESLRQKLYQLTHNQIPHETRSKASNYPESARAHTEPGLQGTESTNDHTKSKNITTVTTKEKITTTTVKSSSRLPISDTTEKKDAQLSTERIINTKWKIPTSPEIEIEDEEERERVLGKSAEKVPVTPSYKGNLLLYRCL